MTIKLSCPYKDTCQYCNPKLSKNNSKDTDLTFDWSFIDKIYCLTLKGRQDRFMQAADEFHKYGLCQRVTFMENEKPTAKDYPSVKNLPELGIWEAHRGALVDAEQRGVRNALIFEDDVVFLPSLTPKILKRVKEILSTLPDKWEIFYLGHIPLLGLPTIIPRTFRTVSCAAHAYVANNSLMKRIKNISYLDQPHRILKPEYGIDVYYMFRTVQYALVPMVAAQRKSETNNPKAKMTNNTYFAQISEYFIKHHQDYEKLFQFWAYFIFPCIILFLLFLFYKFT